MEAYSPALRHRIPGNQADLGGPAIEEDKHGRQRWPGVGYWPELVDFQTHFRARLSDDKVREEGIARGSRTAAAD